MKLARGIPIKITGDRVTSSYSPFFPLSLKVSIKPAARRPSGKIEGNGGKAATSCLTLGGNTESREKEHPGVHPFPRPTFHRDLASSTARSRSTSSHPPTRSPQFFTPLDRSISSRFSTHLLSSSRGIRRQDRHDRGGTRPWISSRRESSISSGRR